MQSIEERIKTELIQTIFSDTFKIYEFIDGYFELNEKQRDTIIYKLNSLNDEIRVCLKESRLT